MGFDIEDLKLCISEHGAAVRVVIADIRGSSPREPGAALLVWEHGQSGTIGGGALEHEAVQIARAQLKAGNHASRLSHHPLGPALGQCCGGTVTLFAETYTRHTISALDGQTVIARATQPSAQPSSETPLPIRRLLAQTRNQGTEIKPLLQHGWLIETVHKPSRQLWIWGAGHVGRAMVSAFAPLPEFDITWIDTGPERFPEDIPRHVTSVPAADPAQLVRHAPDQAEHLILTYSHALDLELCHQLLGHGFGFAGLIGSHTKWARFRARLASLGHSPSEIQRITCPIGQPDLGKHPQAIALGVACTMLQKVAKTTAIRERTA